MVLPISLGYIIHNNVNTISTRLTIRGRQMISLAKRLVPSLLVALNSQVLIAQPLKAHEGDNVLWTKHQVIVSNPLNVKRDDLTCISQSDIGFNFSKDSAYVVKVANAVIQSQLSACFTDNDSLGLALALPLAANENQTVDIYVKEHVNFADTNTQARTQAELQVRVGGTFNADKLEKGDYASVKHYVLPKGHTVGNKLFKYEGFGWESESVAYRYYFDHRGSIDIFGKQKQGLFLNEIGTDDDDYHVLDHWGMDILKVGPSLGLGGIGAWQNGRLFGANNFSEFSVDVHSKPLISSIDLHYKDWLVADQKGDLALSLSIAANSLLTRVKASTTANIEHFATGIVKHDVEVISQINKAGKWSYVATWGEQSLAKDNLGMAIFVETKNLQTFVDDEHNELVIFNASTQPVYYYFSANWSASNEGAKTKAMFVDYLNNTVATLNQPIKVISKANK